MTILLESNSEGIVFFQIYILTVGLLATACAINSILGFEWIYLIHFVIVSDLINPSDFLNQAFF